MSLQGCGLREEVVPHRAEDLVRRARGDKVATDQTRQSDQQMAQSHARLFRDHDGHGLEIVLEEQTRHAHVLGEGLAELAHRVLVRQQVPSRAV